MRGTTFPVVLYFSNINIKMKYARLFIYVGIFLIIMIYFNITECGGGICRNSVMSSRERSLLVTKYNPSALNKAIDAL
jgi:hypothetical protein